MGYNTTVTGRIDITPPLTWNDAASSKYLDPDGIWSVRLEVTETETNIDDGVVLRRTITAIVPAQEEPYKAYHLLDDLQEIADTYPGHTYSGWLECYGEEPTNIYRVGIVHGTAVEQVARIVWPEGGTDD